LTRFVRQSSGLLQEAEVVKKSTKKQGSDAELIYLMRTPAATAMLGGKILAKSPSRQTMYADIRTAKSSTHTT